jgi:hypothetical protein
VLAAILLASHSSVDAQSIYNTAAGAVCVPRKKGEKKRSRRKKNQEQFCFIDWIHKLNATTNLSGLERFVFGLNFVHQLLVSASTACVVFSILLPQTASSLTFCILANSLYLAL